MLKYNGNILKWNGKWGNAAAAPTIYQVHTYTDGNGTLTAVPSSGISGTLVDLTATPNTGYDFKEYQVVGATISDNQLTINDSDVSVTALFEEQAVTYDYFTFKARSNWTCKGDPAYWCAKVYTNSGLYDLTTGTRSNLNTNTSGDAMNWTVTADHLYRLEWVPADVETTRNYNPSRFLEYPVFYNTVYMDGIGEIYSLDFWDKAKWYNARFRYATVIPQDASNIHRGSNLTDCSSMFKDAPLSCNIIPFIQAMLQACPNLTTTTGCFSGCTTAPDYAEALAQYPGWF